MSIIYPQQDASHLNEKDPEQIRIHSIETFGTHDGPGIRFIVFVQGCQFRCLYCHNPDTFDVKGGKFVTLDEIEKRVLRQRPYFGDDGGITISGGEPLLHRTKILTLFKRLKEKGIHTCLDSNGRLVNKQVEELLEYTDLLMLDVKHINDDCHHKLTSVSNGPTLKLAEMREKQGKPMWIRYVLVPGWSDQEEYLHELGQHFKDYKTIEKIEIQPYHKLGVHKWEAMGMEYGLEGVEPPTKEQIEKTVEIFSQYFKEVHVN
ncbi:pyruvate formate lyase-activating protein [Flammeovirga yaeyamensis]|uniref:Pyruvate formate-lyase-activating enzyme n=1 Tax=Flammeovirga yaeyamensis TaxID=367791 RepID=A0AAX1MYM8_9BACT|nr:pyruvate formate-lyase-activating protein [Flammeovirga yaeyamensis]MBB3696139.1 pyruvate formate lyase activating enzyme [Flammeovirga yaeyamensis]NMF34823.1 pyruvate formate lyase-activating protein [Flammeovirga yaeyamensis]QWG00349.1 pyruvate formate lyase-activating protein [Flammeovirga yaeyamensis]